MKKETRIFVAADIHGLDGESNFPKVLALLAADGTAACPEAALMGGDYVGAGGPPGLLSEEERARRWQPAFRLSDVRRELTDVFGEELKTFFTYGSHDKNELGGGESFFCGPATFADYHLYGVSFCQMRYADAAQRSEGRPYDGADADAPTGGCAEQASARFTAWAASLPDSKPIFVMSHIPLHAHRADNLGAELWCRAFNGAAEHHDVFVFFAHNHTAERRSRLDRQYYFVPAGGTMPVQGREKELQPEMRVNFTYLNAGYVVLGCATLVTLRDTDGDGTNDAVEFRRYALRPEDVPFGDTGLDSPQLVRLRHR